MNGLIIGCLVIFTVKGLLSLWPARKRKAVLFMSGLIIRRLVKGLLSLWPEDILHPSTRPTLCTSPRQPHSDGHCYQYSEGEIRDGNCVAEGRYPWSILACMADFFRCYNPLCVSDILPTQKSTTIKTGGVGYLPGATTSVRVALHAATFDEILFEHARRKLFFFQA